MNPKSFFLAAIVIALTGACAHSRVVQEVPGSSGVVAIKNRTHKSSREKAKMYMADNCRPKVYRIMEEGEQVKGDVMYADRLGQVHRDSKKEWFIKYRCR